MARLSTGWLLGEPLTAMPKKPDPPDLFAAAGLVLEEDRVESDAISGPKRARKDLCKTAEISHQRKPALPSPAQRAASGRLEGARRSRGPASPGQRARVGAPRILSPAPVLAFPLERNAAVLAEMIARLPQDRPDDLDAARDREARKLEKRLIRRGLPKQSARQCAMNLLHEAYMESVRSHGEGK